MASDKRSILVFGATGRQGGAVVKALLKAQWPVRALIRDSAAPEVAALHKAGVEIVHGSFSDTDVIRTAMRDAHGVFSVLPGNLDQQDEVRFGTSIADLAAESAVAHFVYSSGASAGEKPTGVARFDAKPLIEAHIRTLPLVSTIVRPMIFMEMLVRPGYGLDEGRFTFFLRPDQAMQLVAVDDIGKFVAAIFADKKRFGGQTLKIASDTVTGCALETSFTEATNRNIAYSRFSDEVLAANPDLAQMATSLIKGPLSEHVDLNVMREINPEIISFRSWLAGSGREALDKALRAGVRPDDINS
jgi:uncharacterized protein YbjT (DUF2867 family)